MKKTTFLLSLLLLGFHVLIIECRAEMESTSYTIPSVVFSSGGTKMTSANFLMNTTTGQPSPLGHPSSGSFIFSNGFLHFSLTAYIDSDGDGIDDNWEIYYFNNLTTANWTSDFDNDGYTDRQEYLNGVASETDPVGIVFNPKVKNAPWGKGYIPPPTDNNIHFLPGMLLLLGSGD